MALRNLDASSDHADWDQKWEGIFDHYQQDLRHAHYIHSQLDASERRLLELAAGSFRDMAALRRMGLDCHGIDFSPEAVGRAKAAFPDYSHAMHTMSGFAMDFGDGEFDLSYHNGFWVLFDDVRIKQLAAEQARVSRHRMIATVHNRHNRNFVEYFDRLKESDPLYDIRFFEVDEIAALMRTVCRDVLVVPVGKGKRHHEDALIRRGITHPRIIGGYLRLSGQRLLQRSERLLCIGELA